MTFYTGSYAANATNRQVFMETTLHDALIAAGWVFVKEYVPTTSHVARVYRNPLANHGGGGGDYYLNVTRTTATGTIQFGVSALFDSATNTHDIVGVSVNNTASVVMRANGTQDVTVVNFNANSNHFHNVGVSDAAFTYYMAVTPQTFVLQAGTLAIYVGLYVPFHAPHATIPPVTVNDLNGNQNTTKGTVLWTPTVTTAGTVSQALQAFVSIDSGAYTTATSTIDYVSGGVAITNIYLITRTTAAPHQGVYGRLRDVGSGVFTGAVLGDTVTTSNGVYRLILVDSYSKFVKE